MNSGELRNLIRAVSPDVGDTEIETITRFLDDQSNSESIPGTVAKSPEFSTLNQLFQQQFNTLRGLANDARSGDAAKVNRARFVLNANLHELNFLAIRAYRDYHDSRGHDLKYLGEVGGRPQFAHKASPQASPQASAQTGAQQPPTLTSSQPLTAPPFMVPPSAVKGFPQPGNYPFQMPRPPASASSAAATPRPPAPSRATLPGFDYDGTTANYGTSLDDINRQRQNLYQFDSTLASAEDVRKRFGRGRDDLEKRATAGGGDDKAVQRVLSAFDKVARSAERLAERNERLGAVEAAKSTRDATRQEARETKQAEQDQAKASAEVKAQQAEELRRLREDEQAKRAAWQRMTGKSSAGDMLYGADKLERDPRGYLMNVAGMMMTGPIMSRMSSLLSNTMGMASRGYQTAGLAGAAAGAAAGASSDLFNLGGNANPQSQATFDQSWDLFKTRVGSTTGADKWMNVASAKLQEAGDTVASGRGSGRSFSGEAAAYAGNTPWWLAAASGPATLATGLSSAAYGRITGRAAPAETRPGMEAPPIIPGIGSAAGSSASYEQYAMSFGMSSLNNSPIDQQKILEQLENMNRRMERLTDNSENLKNIIPAFR